MSAHLEWIGHPCFRVWREGGPVLVMDPYTPSALGLPEITIDGDAIIASSLDDRGHFNPNLVKGSPPVINALDVAAGLSAEVDGAPIFAVPATEDPLHPEGAKDCAMYAVSIGGVWFLHMGDVGYALEAAALMPFEHRCDVLLALAGQYLTPSLDELDALIEILNPTWIVPMHFLIPGLVYEKPVDEFLTHRAGDPVIFTRTSEVVFPLETSSLGKPTIVVLEPSGIKPDTKRRLKGLDIPHLV